MPLMSGFGALEKLPWERINDKIERRVLAGKHGMIVWWKVKAGAHAGAHQHPHEQMGMLLEGELTFTIGGQTRTLKPGEMWRIPGGVEHSAVRQETAALRDFGPAYDREA